ncbi:imidazolonepropionase [Aggregatilinea lenta]|uniref:imidazolonepropionase n=1 Tax=Aggregatilinea lenta TaxID=913108 RepID=UPI000E5BB79F|nr:imidazolonepropionase [Aggregatilinea lenta]
MSESIDFLLTNIGQLCTIPAQDGGPQRGQRFGELGLMEHAAIAVHAGVIVAIGDSDDLSARYSSLHTIDAAGRLVTPGLVDPHTHVVWAGDRADEFERRIAGVTYQQIMAEGGGINRTMLATRQADIHQMMEETKPRLNAMLASGSTTIECKTGYGLNTASELAMLSAIALLDMEHPAELAATFLGAHAVPPEYASDPDGYVRLICDEMLPAVAQWRDEHWPGPLFCDVFCEVGAFELAQTRRILEAAKAQGLLLKVHIDEFEPLGAGRMAAELGATSVDHVVVTSDEDIEAIAQSGTIAVSLPPTPFGLGHIHYTPARRFIDAGAAIAIATDCNPGTGWNENMQFVMALATRYLHLTPAEALVAATINAAYAIERGSQVGSVEIGKQADLVVWDVPSYPHLSYRFGSNLAHTVLKRGQIVFSADWRTLLSWMG